jgi:hypothetical protein
MGMTRRSFLSLLAGLPVVGKLWKPKPSLGTVLTRADLLAAIEKLKALDIPSFRNYHVTYFYNPKTGKMTDTDGNVVQTIDTW